MCGLRFKREAEGIMVNLPPWANREAQEMLVNISPGAKREAEGIMVNLKINEFGFVFRFMIKMFSNCETHRSDEA